MGMFRTRRHTVPALNTTSTADISFMLLIFFLVTTSMDQDKGLQRQLPPIDSKAEAQVTELNRDNVLRLMLCADGTLLLNDSTFDIRQLCQRVASFVEHCPQRQQHVISVDMDRQASYDAYFNMQNEIVAAYRQLREQRARRIYGRGLAACTEAEREALRDYYPQRIAEVYHLEGGEP